MKIVTIGNCIIDNYPDINIHSPGGNALNVAVLSQKEDIEKISFLGIIGDDENGDEIIHLLKSAHVDFSRLRKVKGKTGIVDIELSQTGDRNFVQWDKGVQELVNISLNKVDLSFILSHDIVHSTFDKIILDNAPFLVNDIELSFDFSTSTNIKGFEKLLSYLTFAFFSGDDLDFDESVSLIKDAHELGAKNVIITRGAKDVIFSTQSNIYTQEVEQIIPVDTLGAGDAFISSFLSNFYKVKDCQTLLWKASKEATEICKRHGAF